MISMLSKFLFHFFLVHRMPAERKLGFAVRFWISPMLFQLELCGTRNDLQRIKCIQCWKRSALLFDLAMSFIKYPTVVGRTWTHMSLLVLFRIMASITRRSFSIPNSRFGCISMTPMYKRSVHYFNQTFRVFKSFLCINFRLAPILKPSSINAVVVVTNHFYFCMLFLNTSSLPRTDTSLMHPLQTLHRLTGGRSHQARKKFQSVSHVVPLRQHQIALPANIRILVSFKIKFSELETMKLMFTSVEGLLRMLWMRNTRTWMWFKTRFSTTVPTTISQALETARAAAKKRNTSAEVSLKHRWPRSNSLEEV